LGLIPLAIVAEAPAAAVTDSMMEALMAVLCHDHGKIIYKRDGLASFPLSVFVSSRLVLKPESTLLEDYIVGDHRGVCYQMVEAMLTRGTGSNRTAAQHDRLLFHAQGLPTIKGQIAFYDKSDKLQRIIDRIAIGARAGTRVTGVHLRLERRYAIFATSRDDAIRYITPELEERIMKLPEVVGGTYLNVAFFNDQVAIAADPPRGGLFANGGFYREAIGPNSSEEELREFFRTLFVQSRVGEDIIDTLLPFQGCAEANDSQNTCGFTITGGKL
jgi:hypothetical protein